MNPKKFLLLSLPFILLNLLPGLAHSKVKNKLILGLRDVLIKKTKLDSSQIWVYIIDLNPSQMIEYGAILPKSGKEKQWFSKLPPNLKKKLLDLEK